VLKTTLAERILKSASQGERDYERLRDAALRGIAAYTVLGAPRSRAVIFAHGDHVVGCHQLIAALGEEEKDDAHQVDVEQPRSNQS
jgi:hypothetical protein